MRHTAKRKKPKLNSFTNIKQLLHSIIKSKSTYFYSNDGDSLKSRSDNLANDFRWSSRHCEQSSSGFRLRDGANPTRSSRAMKSYSKIAHCGSTYILPVFCALALLLVLGFAINPFAQSREEVYAAYEPVTSTTGVSLLMETSDALEQQTQVANGVTAYRYNRFKVNKGTDIDKYQVLVQAANGYDSTLVGAENGQVVNAVSGATKGNAMDGAWGYSLAEGAITNEDSLANLEYHALPSSGGTNTNATPYTETKEFTLAFAANIKDKPADHYQTNVLLSVAAGATETTQTGLGFNGITEMQQMTSDICSTAADGLEGRLKDTRDDKVYWVGKLKDGNCWMTQNLDLDLNKANLLTPDNSDVTENWPSSALTSGLWVGDKSNYTIIKYYDPGNYYYATPDAWIFCSSIGGLAECTEKGWKKLNDYASMIANNPTWTATSVSGFYEATSYVSTDGTTICNKEANSYLGDMNSSYIPCRIYSVDYLRDRDTHYLSGNYYSLNAATAGTTPSGGNVTGTGSICPKGWQLPPYGSALKSYYRLLNAYGTYQSNTTLYGSQDIRLAPLYFVPSGYVGANSTSYPSGYIDGAGFYGRYWQHGVGRDGDYGYLLSFYETKVDTGSNSNGTIYFGLSVRCVAK